MAKKPSGGGAEKARSAKTGHYVTKDYAKRNPSTTVVERDKPRGGAKKPKKR